MTFIAVTACCRLLAVDRKTLHRWVAQAGLALEAHPRDARSKGLTEDHLLALARTHHRCLEDRPVAPAAATGLLTVPAAPELPAELLCLLQRLAALPEQLTALEELLAQLVAVVQPLARPSVTAVPGQQPIRAGQPRPAPAPKAQARRALAKPAPRPVPSVPVIPRVEYVEEGHYVLLCPKRGVLDLVPDSPEWFAWLAKQSSFRFVGKAGHFSAHHEWRLKKGAWRAHRHIRNHSYTLRLAPTHELTIAVLEQTAAALQAHLS